MCGGRCVWRECVMGGREEYMCVEGDVRIGVLRVVCVHGGRCVCM